MSRPPTVLGLAAVLSLGAIAVQPRLSHAPGDRPAPNPSATRSVTMARNGLIAASQPLAAAAGLQVLLEGGNAVDAAVTAAAVLAVIEPTMNGIGGDLFAIVHDGRTRSLHGLNASGRSPYAATPEALAARGLHEVPARGILSVSVPGVVDGWAALLERFGTISLARALAPAIRYAREGFPVAEIVAVQWQTVEGVLGRDEAAARIFLPGGRAPRAGEVFRNPALAATLETIARRGRDAFYKGPIAEAIAADAERRGGLLARRDLAEHRSDWVDPISTSYRGHEVFELPPNTQGIVALEMLNILEGYDLRALGHNSAEYLHLLVEAKRVAFADRDAFIADPDATPRAAVTRMLSKEYAAERRAAIDPQRAARDVRPGASEPSGPSRGVRGPAEEREAGDTVYLTAADAGGTVVSLIQSIFSTFGAGIVAGDTGVVLHNRASLFTMDAGHPNRLAPHKRPLHTLVPAMVLKDGRPWLSFGVMGGDMQPQGHVQVLVNLIDFGMNVQEAGEAARIRHSEAGVAVESGVPAAARFGLIRRGHRVVAGVDVFGGFQGILIDPTTGVLMGGSDPRKDGLAIGY
jgi:gamma-glutamyltranspeptidase/glutathione hydrolase